MAHIPKIRSIVGRVPKVTNFDSGLIGSENSHQLADNTTKFLVRSRTPANLKLAFSAGGTATNWVTIPARASYTERHIDFSGEIFLSADKANQVIEIVEWST
jgi:hypothetical protein